LAVVPGPLHRQQHGSTPLPADADPLDHAQDGQDHRTPNADRLVGRNEGDQKGGDAHQEQRCNQRRLAADTVAVMAEDRRADRAADEPNEIGTERRESGRERIFVRKVQLAEHQAGRRTVDEKIVPLDSRADRRGDDGLTQLSAVIGWG